MTRRADTGFYQRNAGSSGINVGRGLAPAFLLVFWGIRDMIKEKDESGYE